MEKGWKVGTNTAAEGVREAHKPWEAMGSAQGGKEDWRLSSRRTGGGHGKVGDWTGRKRPYC